MVQIDSYSKELNSTAEEIFGRFHHGKFFTISIPKQIILDAIKDAIIEIRDLILYWYPDRDEAIGKIQHPGWIARFRVWQIVNKHLFEHVGRDFIEAIYQEFLNKGKSIHVVN